MRPWAKKFVHAIGFGWIAEIAENQEAKRAGKPKPYTPGEIAVDAAKSIVGAGERVSKIIK